MSEGPEDVLRRYIMDDGEDVWQDDALAALQQLIEGRDRWKLRIEQLGAIRLSCCGDQLSQHTANGIPVECECGCRVLLPQETP